MAKYFIRNPNGKEVATPITPDDLISQILKYTNLQERIIALYEICPDNEEGWNAPEIQDKLRAIEKEKWTGDAGGREVKYLKKDGKRYPLVGVNKYVANVGGPVVFVVEKKK